MNRLLLNAISNGGPGSGDFGHPGRPGKVGGSGKGVFGRISAKKRLEASYSNKLKDLYNTKAEFKNGHTSIIQSGDNFETIVSADIGKDKSLCIQETTTYSNGVKDQLCSGTNFNLEQVKRYREFETDGAEKDLTRQPSHNEPEHLTGITTQDIERRSYVKKSDNVRTQVDRIVRGLEDTREQTYKAYVALETKGEVKGNGRSVSFGGEGEYPKMNYSAQTFKTPDDAVQYAKLMYTATDEMNEAINLSKRLK